MTGKDPDALRGCETGFDIADVLEQRDSIDIRDAKTNEYRVEMEIDTTLNSVISRRGLPTGWEIEAVEFSDDSADVTLIDTAHQHLAERA